jgi:hypothetical protein
MILEEKEHSGTMLTETFVAVPVIHLASLFGTSKEQRCLFFPSVLCRLRGEGNWLSSCFYSFAYALSCDDLV